MKVDLAKVLSALTRGALIITQQGVEIDTLKTENATLKANLAEAQADLDEMVKEFESGLPVFGGSTGGIVTPAVNPVA